MPLPAMPAGAPWWEWLIGIAIIVGIPALCGVAVAWVQRPVRAAVRAAAADARIIRDQTENNHADAPYPNFRDEVTSIREAVEGLVEAHAETRRDVAGMRSEIRQERSERAQLSGRVTHLEQQH